MELFFVLLVTTLLALFLYKILHSLNSITSRSKLQLPPGPKHVPIISTLSWILKPTLDIEKSITLLLSKYGEIITIKVGPYHLIFISSSSLAHEALVQKGAVFSNRPEPLLTARILTSNQVNISSASYGRTWINLRRNLTSQILHPSRSKDFCRARKLALDMLLRRIRVQNNGGVVQVLEHFRFAIFSLLVFICFGENVDESKIIELEAVQHRLITSYNHFFVLDFLWISITKVLLSRRWSELFELKKKRHELVLPLIKESLETSSYVNTLLKLEISEESCSASKRKLTEEELVNLCSEFLNAGTDNTAAALQWIMANLVKYPKIQAKLFEEINGVVENNSSEVGEDDLSKMPYLKAVVLEGLRRHPPSNFLVPHAVTQEVQLGEYKVPKNAIINVMVANMGWDPKVWENPMNFDPERFLSHDFDITGSHGIKMMPFGAGRRMCPAYKLALLHLQYFVANLVLNFKWVAKDADEIDLSQKQEFSIVMKYPLKAQVFPRKTSAMS